jgi:hypothetical protein
MSLLDIIEKNGEKIAIIVLHGRNRSDDVLQWQKKVMVDYFGLKINYFECPFPGVSHGQCMNMILKETVDLPDGPDYYLFIDNDAIFLKDVCLDLIYDFVKNKMTVFGHAWQSNHKKGPNGMIPHAYASQATLCFSKSLYNALGRPDCDHWIARSDTSEELTYRAKELGYIVALIYPSHSVEPNTDLDNGCRFGLGNTYGPNLMYHVSQQNNPQSAELFIQKCKDVIDGKFK